MTVQIIIQRSKRMKHLTSNIAVFVLIVNLLVPHSLFAQVQTTEVLELSEQVRQKRQERQRLEQEAAKLRREIEDKQKEAASLKNQIAIIDDRIAATEA